VGSAVGHTIGHAMTGGGGHAVAEAAPAAVGAAAPAYSAPEQQQPMQGGPGPCAWEIQQFLQCSQQQADITLCQGFNEAIRECKLRHGLQL